MAEIIERNENVKTSSSVMLDWGPKFDYPDGNNLHFIYVKEEKK